MSNHLFFLFQVPFADALDLVRGRKVYLENVSSLTEKDTNYFFKIRKMKREAQTSNNFVFNIGIIIMTIITLFTVDEIVRVMKLSKRDALIIIKETYCNIIVVNQTESEYKSNQTRELIQRLHDYTLLPI